MTTTSSPFIRSKKHRFQQPVATAFSSLLLLSGSAAAQEASDVVELDTMKVEADSASYRAETASSAQFTQPLLDTPQTIQVITNQVFTEQGATTLTEALRNSAGVGTFYAGENGNTTTGDSIYMRGFDTSGSIFVDDVRDIGSISRDLFNIEQVEVEKGPAGTDSGRTAPSGAINMVTKQANLRDANLSSVTMGTDGQERVTADINQTLDGLPGSAVRLNVLWQDSDVAGRDHVNNSRNGLAASFGFGLDTDTRAYLNLLYVKQDNIPDGYVPTVGIDHWSPQAGLENLVGNPVDSENFYGTRQDHDDVTAKMATLRFEHDFSEQVKLTNTLRWGETKQDYLLTAFMSTGTNITYSDVNDLSTYMLARSNSTFKDIENSILTDQLNLRVDFATGSVEHNLVTGLELTKEEQTSYGIASTGSRPPANLYNPDWNDSGDLAYSRSGAKSEGETDTYSLYVFDTLKFGEQFLISGGVRADRYNTDYSSNAVCNNGTGRGAVSCGALPVGSIVSTIDTDDSDTLLNWKLGAVYKPVPQTSLYANYALSQQPPGGLNFQLSDSASSASNPDMDPQKANTYEVGVKWDAVPNRLTLNAAVFRTDVLNEISEDDLGNPTQDGEKRVEGVELSMIGNITPDWSVTAGYTHLDTEVTEGDTITANGSNNLTYTPDNAFTSWTTYRFPSGLTIGGGARYTAGLTRGSDGAQGTPDHTDSYTVFDAVVSYPVLDNVSLRLNAYNLADEEYVAAINKSGYRYTPGTPRTFLLSADMSF
ncbi:MAG: catecholate siderophore receptor Fiu [Halopseudomonas sp.]|uniref:catecholate siderophore receptor Fiu n=1 Tax=Halopseudomonas sp. TaxID=2901191 RepID=UPI00300139F8